MVQTLIQTGRPIDFSFIPSFKCNLECWFCMYDCGPDNPIKLDYNKAAAFASQIDWSMINGVGFYGGEPSIEMELYDKFIALVPDNINKFVITNGTWSTNINKTFKFLDWCVLHKFYVIVSGTPEHTKYQDRSLLEDIQADHPKELLLKKPDEIHAQGRAAGIEGVNNDCEFTCQRKDRNMRLGLRPDGRIIFQNCHGEYITVQTYENPFIGMYERAKQLYQRCYKVRKL